MRLICEKPVWPFGRTPSLRLSHPHTLSFSLIQHLSPANRPRSQMEYRPPQGSELQFDHYRSDGHRPVTPDHPVFDQPLLPPAGLHIEPSIGPSTPRDSYAMNSAANSAPLLPGIREKGFNGAGSYTRKSQPLYKKPLVWILAVVGIALIAAAVVVPVYFTVIKPKNNSVTGGSGGNPNNNNNGSNSTDPPTHHKPPTTGISGGDGSTIKTDDGTEFTYSNQFGGICEFLQKFPAPPCF